MKPVAGLLVQIIVAQAADTSGMSDTLQLFCMVRLAVTSSMVEPSSAI